MRPRKNNNRLNLRAMDCALRCLQALPASPSASYVMLHTLHYIKRCAPASLDLCVAAAAEGEERRGEALSRFSERLSRGNAGRAPLSLFLGPSVSPTCLLLHIFHGEGENVPLLPSENTE